MTVHCDEARQAIAAGPSCVLGFPGSGTRSDHRERAITGPTGGGPEGGGSPSPDSRFSGYRADTPKARVGAAGGGSAEGGTEAVLPFAASLEGEQPGERSSADIGDGANGAGADREAARLARRRAGTAWRRSDRVYAVAQH